MPKTHEIDRESAPRPLGYWLEEHDYLSPNAIAILRYIKQPAFQRLRALAEVIDSGDAKCDEAELNLMYDNLPELADTVVDLYNMVRRRDERIDALEYEAFDARQESRNESERD